MQARLLVTHGINKDGDPAQVPIKPALQLQLHQGGDKLYGFGKAEVKQPSGLVQGASDT